MAVEYTCDQKRALSALRGKNNILLTGPAGVGKSFIFNDFLNMSLKDHCDGEFPVLASTGAAAVLVGGRTFHSFFGLGTMQKPRNQVVMEAVYNKNVVSRIKRAKSVAIDEISMLSAETIEVAEEISRLVRENGNPWGGMRIIASGDFLQLPPISTGNQSAEWAFKGNVWEESQFKPCVLRQIVRTKDPEFVRVLHQVRRGIYDMEVYNFLLERLVSAEQADDFNGTILYPHRSSVNTLNLKKLNELEGEPKTYVTRFEGDSRYFPKLMHTMPIPEHLVLKKGALVMIRRNDPYGTYVNGSLAIVEKLGASFINLRLLDDGVCIELPRARYEWFDGRGDVACSATNFPLTLAWACTIHKAQGATIDKICVDLRGVWECGQSYVALSRVRSAGDLFVLGWDQTSIKADQDVVAFYDELERIQNSGPEIEEPEVSQEQSQHDSDSPAYLSPALTLLEQKIRQFGYEPKIFNSGLHIKVGVGMDIYDFWPTTGTFSLNGVVVRGAFFLDELKKRAELPCTPNTVPGDLDDDDDIPF